MELPARVRNLSEENSSRSSLYTTRTRNSSLRSELGRSSSRPSSGQSKRRPSTGLSDVSIGTWPSFNTATNFNLDFNNSYDLDTLFNITGANSNPDRSGVDELIYNPIKRSSSLC